MNVLRGGLCGLIVNNGWEIKSQVTLIMWSIWENCNHVMTANKDNALLYYFGTSKNNSRNLKGPVSPTTYTF